jgi:hypothetical protein
MNSLRTMARNIIAAELGFTDPHTIRDVRVMKPNTLFATNNITVPAGQYVAGMDSSGTIVQLYAMTNPACNFNVATDVLRLAAKELIVEINEF